METKKIEQENQEKEEIEEQEKCEFATFLDLTPKSSGKDETPTTPSPKKMNTRKSWEMTDAITRSPRKNVQYLIKKPRITRAGNIYLYHY